MSNRRRSTDDHADLRIAFESDAELLADAIGQHLDHGIDLDLLRRVADRFAKSRHALAKYERAHGLDLGRDEYRVTLTDLIVRAEVDGDIENSSDCGGAACSADGEKLGHCVTASFLRGESVIPHS